MLKIIGTSVDIKESIGTPIGGKLNSGSMDDDITLVGTQRSSLPKSQGDKPLPFYGESSLVFKWERFDTIAKELLPLFKAHWEEIALNQDRIPLDPDWDRYFNLSLQNILHILTVREGGRLLGYIFMLVHPGLHYVSTLLAVSDIYWLHPDLRFGWTGVKMFKEVERHMRELGVKVIMCNIKLHFQNGRVDKLFQRLGYKPIETLFSKYLE